MNTTPAQSSAALAVAKRQTGPRHTKLMTWLTRAACANALTRGARRRRSTSLPPTGLAAAPPDANR
eukprot:11206154-Lingulodinium_polyedra.AAC.1